MRLSRDKIQRMINAGGGSSSGGGGGSDIAGGVTQAWVNQNYVSIEFFRKVFKVWAAGETSSDPDVEIMPNDITTTVKNIQAQAGLWTEAFLSALGQGSGGGTGGATTLDQLDDVVITSPTNGQALIYNATTQMWVNGTIQSGTDMATVWSALAAATNEQINASHLSGVLADYVTTTSLQTILGDYLTQTSADQRYITIAYFDRLFRAYNGSTLVSHNDTTTTIDNIKAMFGFWTDMYLSAIGRNSAATGLGIDNLTDVTINTPTSGQVLQYNATSSKWENATIQTVVALSGLTDVLLTSLQTNQALIYDGTKWINSTLKTVNGYSILGSGDIQVGGGAGNYLPLTGGTMNGNTGEMIKIITSVADSYIIFFPNNTYKAVVGYADGYALLGGGAAVSYARIILNEYGRPYWGYYSGGSSGSFIFSKILYDTITNATINGMLTVENIATSRYIISPHPDTTGFVLKNTSNSNVAQFGYYRDHAFVGDFYNSVDNSYISFYDDGHVLIGGSTSNTWRLQVDNLVQCKGIAGSEVDDSYTATRMWGMYQWDNYLTINARNTSNAHVSDIVSINLTNYMVGIGVTPSYKLHVDGTIYATGAVTALSDARKKDVHGDAKIGVEQIAHAPAVQFLWKDKERRKDGQQVGTLAQYWQTVLPEVVSDKGGELSMQYGVAALVSAIVTARKVVDHEQRITEIEKENERLRTEVEQLRLN